MNSTYDVYKCIDNNGGAASTVEPTGNKSTSVFSTGDSYKWKYMYSLTADEQTNFLSTDFMHVSTESTDYSTTEWCNRTCKNYGSQVLVEQTEHTQTLQSEVTDQVVLLQ